MDTAERVKILRKELGLSQEKFGNAIGKGKVAISHIEKGKVGLTEANAKAICRAFNVDYFWLTQGVGEMFTHFEDVMMQQLIDTYNLSEMEQSIILAYLQSDKQTRELIGSFITNLADKLKKAD